MAHSVVSELQWNHNVETLSKAQAPMLRKDVSTGRVAATSWFSSKIGSALTGCFKAEANQTSIASEVAAFRHRCRGLVAAAEEHELSFLGRRVRGEIFFARRWVPVEGQSELVLLHAIGRALHYPLDRHGGAVIDFQNNGDADNYPALATSFGIPWCMITDGDPESSKFQQQLRDRGFSDDDIDNCFATLIDMAA